MQLTLLPRKLDDIRHDNGTPFWRARELYPFLGYKTWENFITTVERAIESCRTSGYGVENHFRGTTKMVQIGSGAERLIEDYELTRFACYLIALNGDPRIPEIALAQAYFATITRKHEILQQRVEEIKRLSARTKLKKTEKMFSRVLFERGVEGADIGKIRNIGDKMLFGGKTTQEMKEKLGVKSKNKPLADVLASILIKAKDFAASMTIFNTKKKDLYGKIPIKKEHIASNVGVRTTLTETGIRPETLSPAEDIKQIERKHERERKILAIKHRKELQESFNGKEKIKDI